MRYQKKLGEYSLLSQIVEITTLGIILTLVMAFVERHITGSGIIIICCFLALTYLWKLFWPIQRLRRYAGWRIFSIVMVGIFSWWLIYTAENTRAGWYRTNVLQQRIQKFVNEAPSYIIVSDAEGYITATSDNIMIITGYTPKELLGQQITSLMRDVPAAKHQNTFDKAVAALRGNDKGSGWLLQGLVIVGIKHKDGSLVPAKAYAAGIRWSTDIQFKGDIDMFAVFVPVSKEENLTGHSTVKENEGYVIKYVDKPPVVSTLSPVPDRIPSAVPKKDNASVIIKR